MLEDILMKQVSFIDEKDRMDLARPELVHMRADCVENCGRGGRRRQFECKTDMTIEVATAERGVVAIGESKAVLRKAMPECT